MTITSGKNETNAILASFQAIVYAGTATALRHEWDASTHSMHETLHEQVHEQVRPAFRQVRRGAPNGIRTRATALKDRSSPATSPTWAYSACPERDFDCSTGAGRSWFVRQTAPRH